MMMMQIRDTFLAETPQKLGALASSKTVTQPHFFPSDSVQQQIIPHSPEILMCSWPVLKQI
jgi:hypothetical protein